MRRVALAGLKCRHILPKTIRSCLGPRSSLPYTWPDKLREMVLGIALSRSVILQDIARTQQGPIKTVENKLSNFLSQERLNLDQEHRRYVVQCLRGLGSKRFVRYQGKLVVVVDTTSYPKVRSRGQQRPMPRTGKVRLHNIPGDELLLAPGYQEIWAGLLLKNGKCLPITRELFTEKMEFFVSQNALEEREIRRAVEIVKEVFQRKVILVADRGFKRKELLYWLKTVDKVDFIIRIDGNLNIRMAGWDGKLSDIVVHQPGKATLFWREDTKKAVLCHVHSGRMRIKTGSDSVDLYAVCLTAVEGNLKPVFLATSLAIRDRKTLSWVVRTYSKRWTIETFFFDFKQSLRVDGFRVFSCWTAIDNLLAMAHMAFLALYLLYLELDGDGALRRILRLRLRYWFARPPQFTLGRLMEWVAMDFVQCSWVEGAL